MIRRLVLDTETGGLEPKIHGLTEVCAIVCEFRPDWSDFAVVGRCHSFVKPESGMVYTDEALELQKTTLAELDEKGRPLPQVIEGLRKFVIHNFGEEKKCGPVAQNAGFDKGFMDAAYARLGVAAATNHCWLCSMQLFRWLGVGGAHDSYRANLDAICRHYRIQISDEARHTAYGDVEATAQAVACMMQDFRRQRRAA